MTNLLRIGWATLIVACSIVASCIPFEEAREEFCLEADPSRRQEFCPTGSNSDGGTEPALDAGTDGGTLPTQCTAASECTKPQPGQCIDSGDCVDGRCVYVFKDDGTGCSGTAPSQCHEPTGTCSSGQCAYAFKARQASCDDGNPCTAYDVCDGAGGCRGTALSCNSPPSPCHEWVGSCSNNVCNYQLKPVNTVCGSPTHGGWEACGGFSNFCSTTGTQSRSVTSYACTAAGACELSNSTETQACTRAVTSCAEPTYGAWSACDGFSNTCDTTGTQTRSVTTYSLNCATGQCVPSTTTETQVCSRSTEGSSCGSPTYGNWSVCSDFVGTCGQTGSHSRSVTTYACSSGSCVASTSSQSQACSRNTNGTSCGQTVFGSWSICGNFSDYCDTTGTQSRSVTQYVCSAGACSASTTTETQGCSRTVQVCSGPSYGPWGNCEGVGCNTTGTQIRTVTSYSLNCDTGNCDASTSTETQACSRNPQGQPCDDGNACTVGDMCSSAGQCVANGTTPCPDKPFNCMVADGCNPQSGCVYRYACHAPTPYCCYDDLGSCTGDVRQCLYAR